MKIYLDLLFLSNFLLDYSLITYTGIIANVKIKVVRIIIATLFAVSGLMLFFVKIKLLFFILRVVWGFIIILLAFDFISVKHFLKNCLIFYFLNYLVAGIIISYDFQFTKQAMLVDLNNHITWYFLVISFIFAISLTYIYKVVVEYNMRLKSTILDVTIRFLNHEYNIKGLVDSGNMVTSPYDRIPVIFIDKDIIDLDINENSLKINKVKFRYVVYKTLRSRYITIAFKPDFFGIVVNQKLQEKEVYIATVDNLKTKHEQYHAILNANIFS